MKERLFVVEDDDEAPNAMPSAAAWMHSPNVVDRDREGEDRRSLGGGEVDRSDRE